LTQMSEDNIIMCQMYIQKKSKALNYCLIYWHSVPITCQTIYRETLQMDYFVCLFITLLWWFFLPMMD